MFKHSLDYRLGQGPNQEESVNKYKQPQEDLIDKDPNEEVLDLSHDPDAGHLEAEKIIEKRHLDKLEAKNEAEELEEIEQARKEDRDDLEKTYRRF